MFCVDGDIKEFLSKLVSSGNSNAFMSQKECLYTIDKTNKKLLTKSSSNGKHGHYQREIYSTSFIHAKYNQLNLSSYRWITTECFSIENPIKETSVVMLLLRNRALIDNLNSNFTILFSQGNASTLGSIYSFLFDLSTQWKCNVAAYDYNGYGQSKGKASEESIKENIEEVYVFMRNHLRIQKDNIVLYGVSIGSVPSCSLCSRHEVGGMILQSPIASSNLFLNREYKLKEGQCDQDKFCNWSKVGTIGSPIMLIHGQNDRVIRINHSLMLEERIAQLVKWYPSRGTHINIQESYREKFLRKTLSFLESIYQSKLKIKMEKKRTVSDSSFEMKEKNGEKLNDFDDKGNLVTKEKDSVI